MGCLEIACLYYPQGSLGSSYDRELSHGHQRGLIRCLPRLSWKEGGGYSGEVEPSHRSLICAVALTMNEHDYAPVGKIQEVVGKPPGAEWQDYC